MATRQVWRFSGPLWVHTGESPWSFVTLPFDVADEIGEIAPDATRGFGSVKVDVTVGTTTWTTSLFPDRAARSYLLPVKRQVRTAERLVPGDEVDVELVLTAPDPGRHG